VAPRDSTLASFAFARRNAAPKAISRARQLRPTTAVAPAIFLAGQGLPERRSKVATSTAGPGLFPDNPRRSQLRKWLGTCRVAPQQGQRADAPGPNERRNRSRRQRARRDIRRQQLGNNSRANHRSGRRRCHGFRIKVNGEEPPPVCEAAESTETIISISWSISARSRETVESVVMS
jgi:hypothetical protein